jgi:aspartyl protease family protein
MRNIVLFAISTLALAGLIGRMSGTSGVKPTAMVAHAGTPAKPTASPSVAKKKASGVAYVRLDRNNSFSTGIEIEGKPFQAIIDTGASIVALRYEDAKALGLFSKGEQWNRMVSTANGAGKAMSVRLNNLSIGDLVVYDVEALVLAPGALSVNLIGMSLLKRLYKFEVRPDVIVLER